MPSSQVLQTVAKDANAMILSDVHVLRVNERLPRSLLYCSLYSLLSISMLQKILHCISYWVL